MHPAMAVWIWSVSMARAWQSSLWNPADFVPMPGVSDRQPIVLPQSHAKASSFVLANSYLHSDIAQTPLPAPLLDRLADLYWMERDSELAI